MANIIKKTLSLILLSMILGISGCQSSGNGAGDLNTDESAIAEAEANTSVGEDAAAQDNDMANVDEVASAPAEESTGSDDMEGIIGEQDYIEPQVYVYSWHYVDEMESPYLFTDAASLQSFLTEKALAESDIALAHQLDTTYDDAYFEEQDLAVIYVPKHSSADSTHFVEASILPGNMLNVVLDSYCPGETEGAIETMDMAADLVVLEVPKGFSEILSSRG